MDFKLRAFKLTDLNNLVKFANNKKIADRLTDAFPHPYGMKDGIKFIEMTMQHDPKQIFAIDIEGKVCGAIGLHPQNDIHKMNAELGYWLAEPYWGNGIIANAIIQMIDYGFEKFEINRIFARPFGSNIASQRVLEKAGFIKEGIFEKAIFKNGTFEDEIFYAVRRKETK